MEEVVSLQPDIQQRKMKKSIRAGNRLLLWIQIILYLIIGILYYNGITVFDDWVTLVCFAGLPLIYTYIKLDGDLKEVFKFLSLMIF